MLPYLARRRAEKNVLEPFQSKERPTRKRGSQEEGPRRLQESQVLPLLRRIQRSRQKGRRIGPEGGLRQIQRKECPQRSLERVH